MKDAAQSVCVREREGERERGRERDAVLMEGKITEHTGGQEYFAGIELFRFSQRSQKCRKSESKWTIIY